MLIQNYKANLLKFEGYWKWYFCFLSLVQIVWFTSGFVIDGAKLNLQQEQSRLVDIYGNKWLLFYLLAVESFHKLKQTLELALYIWLQTCTSIGRSVSM